MSFCVLRKTDLRTFFARESSSTRTQLFETPTANANGQSEHVPQLNSPLSVYLCTYSQADILMQVTAGEFGEMIANEFDKGKLKSVVQWVSSAELHKTEGVHYRHATKPQRQKQVKLNIEREHGTVIDFVGFHDTYYDAFTYITKQDSHYVTSSGHVDLDNRPLKVSVAIHAK